MTRLLTVLTAAVLAAATLGTIGFSGAGFSAQTANPGNAIGTAESFCPNPGTTTLPAIRDAYVYQLNPSQNFGSDSTLQVSPGVLGLLVIHRTLVGFDLESISPFCSIISATLRLYATSAASGRTIGVYRAASSWNEGAVTWNNQPATIGSAVTGASGTGWRTWSVTSQVNAMISGSNDGFLVRDQSEAALLSLQAQVYQSREGTTNNQDPELLLTLE